MKYDWLHTVMLLLMIGMLGVHFDVLDKSNKGDKAIIWTADYIRNTQLADSINKYAQQGYEIELLTMDTITDEGLEIMRMAIKKDIRALPYVEIKER